MNNKTIEGVDGPEEAIPLVIFNNESKTFELNEEGRGYLSGLGSPLGVVAVAGMYRTGKSYLLNRMILDRCDGFGVGPTINPCTKGVWMWGKPIMGTTPDGDPIQVIILDTEGMGALDEDSNHDVRIFSLSILLSSYFIYNSVGSIDENALQNLSLVINLTKHIQIKQQGIQEDVDPEEFAQYFPSFMWVVRDFTLQLVDQDGEMISPKEYLEKALSSQKGFSDAIEQKNRIRRLLKSFFHERDCVTMIRPLTDEEKLQNLINIPLDELRPEFVEQVANIRRKVLGRVKPKKIHGKNLNGAMFWNLMASYVDSINKGSIPNIESSWAYICKNECLKAVDDSYDQYESAMRDELQTGGPFYDTELKEIYSTSKKKSLELFKKTAVGDDKEQFLENLKDKMKNKYNQIKQDNNQTCEQESLMFLNQSYTEIERALKNQQYPGFIDYLQDIEQFKQIFEDSGPPGSQRREIMLEFCMKNVMEAAEFFLGNVSNEMNLQRVLAEDTVRKLTEEIKEVKQDQRQRMENMESKIRKTEMERAEISAKEQSTREIMQQVQSEKRQMEDTLNEKISSMKKDYERQIDEIESKMSNAEEKQKEISRAQVSAESEFDKQKALLDQKIEFLDKAVEDSNRREKELSLELKNSKKDFFNQNKEQTVALEKQIKDQIKQVEDLKEQVYDWESKNCDQENEMEELKGTLELQNGQLSKDLKNAKDHEADLNKKYDNLRKKYENDCNALKSSVDNEKSNFEQKLDQAETSLKETQDQYELAKQSWEKDKAVLQQRLEFVKYQLDDEKKKYEETKQAHESMLGSLQSTNRESTIGREEANSKISQMEDEFLKARKIQEDQYNDSRKKLTNQVEQLKQKNNSIELNQKLQDSEYEKQVMHLKESLSESEASRTEAQNKLKNLDLEKFGQMQENEKRYMEREVLLENEIEEKDKEIEEMITEHNEKSEKQLNELKKFYEDEKVRLEKRVTDEKVRYERKLNQTVEDYEDKIQETTNNHEDAYNNLEDEKNAIEAELSNMLNQLEKESQVMQQQLENKERYLQELKDSYQTLQAQTNKHNDALSEKFSKERRELNERIEQLAGEVSKRERAILQLENQKETYSNQLQGKDKQCDELRSEIQAEKIVLHNKIEELKTKYDSTMDDLTQSKINQEREKALKDQRLSFQDQRIKEYHEQMAQTIERYEERLKLEKEDARKMLQERIARIQQEKENVETKYEQKRKALKESEKNMQQSQAQNDRERAVQAEKYENLERSQQDLIKTYEIENLKLQENNDQLNHALSQGEIGIREQVEHWKSQYYEMERQHADLQSELEKEKALWEGKFEFLEKQKEQAKKDNEDALRQFQSTVDQLQKSQNENKQKHEHNQSLVMQQLEQKFKKEIKDQNENNSNSVTSLNNTIRRLEKENKALNERLELNSKSMMSEAGGLEKKLERITDQRDRLKEEFEGIKADRDKKIDEMRRQFEREKEVLKQKNMDLQQKSKGTEAKQTDLILSHETNRAKWDQEKSYLISAKEDAISELKNIQKRYENSVKEIERLKEQQKRNNWRNSKGQPGAPNMMYKVGEGMLGRLNLGGAGAGLNSRMSERSNNEMAASTANLNIPKNDLSSYRGNIGVDKSVDNFKLGFGNQFGNQLGGGGKMGGGQDMIGQKPQTTTGAAAQGIVPTLGSAMQNSNQKEENSFRQSNNLLSTPSDKGAKEEDN